jgi:hypothetical protein
MPKILYPAPGGGIIKKQKEKKMNCPLKRSFPRGHGPAGRKRIRPLRVFYSLVVLIVSAGFICTGCPLDSEGLTIPGSFGRGSVSGGSGPGGIVLPGGSGGGNNDRDGDGYPNDWEEDHGYDPDDPDSHPDYTNPDGSGNDNVDTDHDGLPDWWEVENHLDPTDGTGNNGANGDPDGDGLVNKQEYEGKKRDSTPWKKPHSNPINRDTDGDGYPDGWEWNHDWDPTDPDSHPGYTNPDGSGNDNVDSDNDGLPDWWEIENSFDPTEKDTDHNGIEDGPDDPDHDGLSNKEEFDGNSSWKYGKTDPLNPDSDGDGYPDGFEAKYPPPDGPYDPTDPDNHPGEIGDADKDGLPDWWEIAHGLDPADNGERDINNGPNGDPDNDGLTNKQEYDGKPGMGWKEDHTNPLNHDTDGDGYPDKWEYDSNRWDPTDPNSHPDYINNPAEDTDHDGFTDKDEIEAGTDPTNPESHPDGGILTVTGIPLSSNLSAWIKSDAIDAQDDLSSLIIVADGFGAARGMPLYNAATNTPFIKTGDYYVIVIYRTEIRYTERALPFEKGNAVAAWEALKPIANLPDTGTTPPAGSGDGVLAVTGTTGVVYTLVVNGTITQKSDLDHVEYVAVGLGPAPRTLPEGVPLFNKYGERFRASASYTVIVTRGSETKFKGGVSFTNGKAQVDWNTGLQVLPDEILPPVPPAPPVVPDPDGIYVSRFGNDSWSGTRAKPKLSLNQAVKDASLTTDPYHRVIVVGELHGKQNAKVWNTDADSSFNIAAKTATPVTIEGIESDPVKDTGFTGREKPALIGQGGTRRTMEISSPSVITIKKLTITGGHFSALYGGGIYASFATLTLGEGARITGNWAKYGGGGLALYQASCYLNGGEIDTNTTDAYDTGCGGGGVIVQYSTLTMGPNSSIHNNACLDNDGGGVYLDFGGKLIMEGGAIYKNTCRETGGGVNIATVSSVFTMKDGEIYSNTTTGSGNKCSGGGVTKEEGGRFDKFGGTIYGINGGDKKNQSGRGFTHAYADKEYPKKDETNRYKDNTF